MNRKQLSMAKRKGEAAKTKPLGGPEQIMREMAAKLRLHADYLDQCIVAWERVGSPSMRILPGNFYHYLRQIRGFFTKQIVSKMASASTDVAEIHHEVFAELFKLKGDLAAKMPKAVEGEEKDD